MARLLHFVLKRHDCDKIRCAAAFDAVGVDINIRVVESHDLDLNPKFDDLRLNLT